jgi:hypothetical protein
MKNTLLKIILAAISAYHIIFGLFAFLSKDLAVQIGRSVFHMNIVLTDQMGYIINLLGIYAFVFGLFAALAAYRPAKYMHVIYIGIALYAMRLINRLVFAGTVRNAFGVPQSNLWLELILIIFFGVTLYLLRPEPEPSTR